MVEKRHYLDDIYQRIILARVIIPVKGSEHKEVFKVVRSINYVPKRDFYHFREIEEVKKQGVEVDILYANKMKLQKSPAPQPDEAQVFIRKKDYAGTGDQYFVEKTKNIALPTERFVSLDELDVLNNYNVHLEINFMENV